MAGRTVSKYFKIQIGDSSNVLRDLAVNTITPPPGIVYEGVDVSALQESLKSELTNRGTVGPFTITGPFSTTAAGTASVSGAAPNPSGCHNVLPALNGSNTPRTFAVYYGILQYWTTATDPVFGGKQMFVVSEYTVDPIAMTYSAKISLSGARTADPDWGVLVIAGS